MAVLLYSLLHAITMFCYERLLSISFAFLPSIPSPKLLLLCSTTREREVIHQVVVKCMFPEPKPEVTYFPVIILLGGRYFCSPDGVTTLSDESCYRRDAAQEAHLARGYD